MAEVSTSQDKTPVEGQLNQFNSLPINFAPVRPPTKYFPKGINKASVKNQHLKKIQRLYTEVPPRHLYSSKSKKMTNVVPSNKVMRYQTANSSSALGVPIKSTKNGSQKNGKLLSNEVGPQYNDHLACPLSRQQLVYENIQLRTQVKNIKDQLAQQRIMTENQKRKNRTFTNKLNREFKKDFYYSNLSNQVSSTQNKSSVKIIKSLNEINDRHDEYLSPEKGQQSQGKDSDSGKNHPLLYINTNSSKKPMAIPSLASNTSTHSAQYLIAGVKNQYEQLKEKYSLLQKQHRALKQTDIVQKLEEYKIYCSALQQENAKLVRKLESLRQKIQDSPEDRQRVQILEISQKLQKSKERNSALKQQLKELQKQSKQNKKIVTYLEHLLIQKDSSEFKSIRQVKIMQKQLNNFQTELQSEREMNQNLKISYSQQLEDITKKYQYQSEKQREIFDSALNERNQLVKKLEKQIVYLTTVLSYWKPNNAPDQPSHSKTRKESLSIRELEKSFNKEKEEQELFSVHQQEESGKRLGPRKASVDYLSIKSNMTNRVSKPGTSRIPRKTSAVKHSKDCKKSRRVSIEQLQAKQLPELLKYRLIGYNISLDALGQYFQRLQHKKEGSDCESDEDNELEISTKQHAKIYITQRQLTSIFTLKPFCLEKQDAYLLSRYIVQDEFIFQHNDVNNPFVYESVENEVERSLVKSIMRAFILDQGKNDVPTGGSWDPKKMEEQWIKTMNKSGGRLSTALVSIAPKGFIAKSRWSDLLRSINIEVDPLIMEWCIAKMVLESSSIENLKYAPLMTYYKE